MWTAPAQVLLRAQLAVAAALHATLPGDMEATVAALVIGGLFHFALIVIFLMVLTVRWAGLAGAVVVAWYAMVVLLDRAPYGPPEPRPQTPLERSAEAFYASAMHYFPTTLTISDQAAAAMAENERLVFAVHPHGIHCWPLNVFGLRCSQLRTRFPRLRCVGLAAAVMFKLPGVREIFLHMGYVDASRSVAQKCLDSGASIFVCTGGEKESLLSKPGVDAVVLEHRKGFVRLALASGARVVPVFGFGNTDLYPTYDILSGLRAWIQRTLALALPVFHGRFFLTPLPYRKPLHIVVGDPVDYPSADTSLDEYHAAYLAALQALHKKHAPSGRTLAIH